MNQPPMLVQRINKFFEEFDCALHWHVPEHKQKVVGELGEYHSLDNPEEYNSSLRKLLKTNLFKLQTTDNGTEYWKAANGDLFSISNNSFFSPYGFAAAQENELRTKKMLDDSLTRQKRKSIANLAGGGTMSLFTFGIVCGMSYIPHIPLLSGLGTMVMAGTGLAFCFGAIKNQYGAEIFENISKDFGVENYDDAHNEFYKQTGNIKQDHLSIGYTAIFRLIKEE
jgi:hypothetical protein